ncbi:DUF3192 domain-containing protein [Shewanella sp. JM162201]|uniref:DUF3192 domain-containing protein n=1 Tax=Shewanella jiangmenensis TaxID=2837387 RepID=A0ABS5V4L3_9GAMM|nr:DUF3192 domain-containing protein [Shewanella jiangmenensis]MBT1444746.1 DUF3192 domain-containing protein [Shewanella jiangmenensis]
MKGLYLAAFLGTSLVLGGCVINVGDNADTHDWQKTEQQNRDGLATLTMGMTKEQVISRMGRADFYEAWQQEGNEVQVLFYRTNRVREDGSTTKDECTPVVLTNNQLTGWGEGAYRKG